MLNEFALLALWLASLLAAAAVGYDRGRWWEGMLLGLLLGPVGVIAAGQLQPTLATVADRQWALAREMEQRRKEYEAELRQRRQARQEIEAWAADVKHVIDRQEATFADGLDELSAELQKFEAARPADESGRIRAWSHWLKEKAYSLRATPRDVLESPPPPGGRPEPR